MFGDEKNLIMTMLEDFFLHYGNPGDGADNIDVPNCFKLNSKTSFIKSMIL